MRGCAFRVIVADVLERPAPRPWNLRAGRGTNSHRRRTAETRDPAAFPLLLAMPLYSATHKAPSSFIAPLFRRSEITGDISDEGQFHQVTDDFLDNLLEKIEVRQGGRRVSVWAGESSSGGSTICVAFCGVPSEQPWRPHALLFLAPAEHLHAASNPDSAVGVRTLFLSLYYTTDLGRGARH